MTVKHDCEDRVEYLHALYGKLMDDMAANHRSEISSIKSAWRWYVIAAFNAGGLLVAIGAIIDAVLR